ELDARTDLFSLGVVFYEAATGSRPFNGASTAAILHELLGTQPPAPDLLSPGLPVQFARIIMRCLEKNRSSRYVSAAELRDELTAFKRIFESGIGLVHRSAMPHARI